MVVYRVPVVPMTGLHRQFLPIGIFLTLEFPLGVPFAVPLAFAGLESALAGMAARRRGWC